MKELKISMEEGKITLQPSEKLSRSEVIVMLINAFEVVKMQIELDIPKEQRLDLEMFITTCLKGLKKDGDSDDKSNK